MGKSLQFVSPPVWPVKPEVGHGQRKSALIVKRGDRFRFLPGNCRIEVLAVEEEYVSHQSIELGVAG